MMRVDSQPIRVLLGKVGLDLHDIGVKYVARGLREAGMEVIYIGPLQTAESLVGAAVTEDPDVIGISSISGEYMSYVPEIMRLLAECQLSPIVVVGGLVAVNDIPALLDLGVCRVFGKQTNMNEISEYLDEEVRSRRQATGERR